MYYHFPQVSITSDNMTIFDQQINNVISGQSYLVQIILKIYYSPIMLGPDSYMQIDLLAYYNGVQVADYAPTTQLNDGGGTSNYPGQLIFVRQPSDSSFQLRLDILLFLGNPPLSALELGVESYVLISPVTNMN